MNVYYSIGKLVAKICFNAFANLKVYGNENVPIKGPLIIAANHLSTADPPLIVSTLNRRLHFLAKKELFSNVITRHIFYTCGAYPLDREGHNAKSINWAVNGLSQDKAILMFPEGTRSIGRDAMQQAKPGIGYLALKSNAPILPIGITGTKNITGYWRIPFPFCKINVTIGPPFTIPPIEGDITHELFQHVSNMIMYRVAQLLPKSYQGYYRLSNLQSKSPISEYPIPPETSY